MIRTPAITCTPNTERIAQCSGCGALSPGWPDAAQRTEDVQRPLFNLRVGSPGAWVLTLCGLCLYTVTNVTHGHRMSAAEAGTALANDRKVASR